MVHFLVELVNNPKVDNPVDNAPEIHKHFTRYSKGEFDGPVIKISQTKAKLTVSCSFEFEDALMRVVLANIPDETVEVKGALISGENFSDILTQYGLSSEWQPELSKGKAQNYTTTLKTPVSISKKQLMQLATDGIKYFNILLSFTAEDKTTSLKMGSKPPRPSSKNPEDSSVQNRLKFCMLKIDNTPAVMTQLIKETMADFEDEIPDKFKSATLTNVYQITDLQLPKRDEVKDSRQFRLRTLRVGTVKRVLEVDKDTFVKEVEFCV